jgi:hypothetical protein
LEEISVLAVGAGIKVEGLATIYPTFVVCIVIKIRMAGDAFLLPVFETPWFIGEACL